jgi:hypothetical protein
MIDLEWVHWADGDTLRPCTKETRRAGSGASLPVVVLCAQLIEPGLTSTDSSRTPLDRWPEFRVQVR